ncbi:hypothetical protein EVAR_40689_1 [Eumeta japonica]|uniref:Uncharacterized protein n=1 Tax=Eumeta variegata TaxID=151549 RepID=A0A4C1XAA1_EUMVA|nr:hypothetical protein EVAR_40689_1 [Eumeta japonica]
MNNIRRSYVFLYDSAGFEKQNGLRRKEEERSDSKHFLKIKTNLKKPSKGLSSYTQPRNISHNMRTGIYRLGTLKYSHLKVFRAKEIDNRTVRDKLGRSTNSKPQTRKESVAISAPRGGGNGR